jgi:hypothetical protein
VLTASEMPDDNADLAQVRVEFERLAPDSPAACPVGVDELLAYLTDEVPHGESLSADDLAFVRTARVEESEYWLWRFREPGVSGDDAYASVSRSGQAVTLGYEANYYALTPEQFILGDYHQVF